MKKEQFKNLFMQELVSAKDAAENQFGVQLPSAIEIELHGAGGNGLLYNVV